MKDRLAKSVFWVFWSRGVIQTLSFLSTIIVARLLNPADYGLLALANIWIGPVTLVCDMGFGAAIIQFHDIDERDLNGCFWLTMGMAGIGILTLYIAAPVIALWFSTPALTNVLRVMSLVLPLSAVRVVPDSLLRKRLEFNRISQSEIVSAIVVIPIVLGAAWAGAGVWALVMGALVASCIQTIVIFWFVGWWPGSRFGGKRFREMISFSLATVGGRVCWAVYQQADTLVVGKVAGKDAVGLYSMAKTLATLPVTKISAVVNQLAFPVMAELQSSPEALRASLTKGIRLVAWITFPLCTGLALVAEDLVRIVLTEKWLSMVPVLQVLCLYALIKSLDVFLPPVLMARYRANFLFGYTAALLGIMLLAFWVAAVWLGVMGVAVTWVVVYPVVMLIMAREALREIQMSWRELWEQLRPPLVATAFMTVTVLVVHQGASSCEHGFTVGRLILVSLTGMICYGVALLGIGGSIRGEMWEVVGWVLPRGREYVIDLTGSFRKK